MGVSAWNNHFASDRFISRRGAGEQEFAAIGMIGDNNLVWCEFENLGMVLSSGLPSIERSYIVGAPA